jgi:hypothetical protein
LIDYDIKMNYTEILFFQSSFLDWEMGNIDFVAIVTEVMKYQFMKNTVIVKITLKG